MNQPRRRVAFSILGTTLDEGFGERRWRRLRPNIAICSQPDLPLDRLELLYSAAHRPLAERVVADIAQVSPRTEVRTHPMEQDDPWDFAGVYSTLLTIARACRFDPEQDDLLVHISTGTHVAQICLFLLTESRELPGRLLQSAPDTEPGAEVGRGRATLIDLDLRRYDSIARRHKDDREVAADLLKDGIQTQNAAFNQLIEEIELVALRSQAPILLQGPTGAGKSSLARRIHALRRQKRRVGEAFVEVNCATLRGDGAMSALFGHARGAFTGAVSARAGLLQEADGGLLFLDEVGELGMEEQAMLLHAVEEGRFRPVGSDKEVKVEFQLIVGTHRDLSLAVRAGRFREDLLARIDTWTFRLPGLRERLEDLQPNLDYELQRVSRELGQRVTLNREARARFLRFATGPEGRWSRNFRDLGSAVRRMATLAPAGRISEGEVEAERRRLLAAWGPPEDAAPEPSSPVGAVLPEGVELDRFEAVQLAEVVRVCRASATLSMAGRRLFAVSRARRSSVNDADRLRKYLARFQLDWDSVRDPAALEAALRRSLSADPSAS